jgi:dTDP-4-dehydrorhamnose reductase
MVHHIVLFGSTGMLGRYLATYFKDRSPFRLTLVTNEEFRVNRESLECIHALLAAKGVDAHTCVINAIGLIPQRFSASGSNADYYLVNGLFPNLLWAACRHLGAKMIQPTTDCVYTGTRGGYTERDVPDETNAYGLAKALGEPVGCTVLRASIIGNELRNKRSFLEWVLSNADGSTISGWDNHMWNGITCLQYCKVVEQIVRENLFWTGVRHILSPDTRSKYEIAQMVVEAYGRSITVRRTSAADPVDKTLATVFETNRVFGVPELCVQIKEQERFVLAE